MGEQKKHRKTRRFTLIYEFECPRGHITEAHVPMGTEAYPCAACLAEMAALAARRGVVLPVVTVARRILSPTRTTFVFADTHRR